MLSIDMFSEISVYIHDIGRLKLQVLIAIGLDLIPPVDKILQIILREII